MLISLYIYIPHLIIVLFMIITTGILVKFLIVNKIKSSEDYCFYTISYLSFIVLTFTEIKISVAYT